MKGGVGAATIAAGTAASPAPSLCPLLLCTMGGQTMPGEQQLGTVSPEENKYPPRPFRSGLRGMSPSLLSQSASVPAVSGGEGSWTQPRTPAAAMDKQAPSHCLLPPSVPASSITGIGKGNPNVHYSSLLS